MTYMMHWFANFTVRVLCQIIVRCVPFHKANDIQFMLLQAPVLGVRSDHNIPWYIWPHKRVDGIMTLWYAMMSNDSEKFIRFFACHTKLLVFNRYWVHSGLPDEGKCRHDALARLPSIRPWRWPAISHPAWAKSNGLGQLSWPSETMFQRLRSSGKCLVAKGTHGLLSATKNQVFHGRHAVRYSTLILAWGPIHCRILMRSRMVSIFLKVRFYIESLMNTDDTDEELSVI